MHRNAFTSIKDNLVDLSGKLAVDFRNHRVDGAEHVRRNQPRFGRRLLRQLIRMPHEIFIPFAIKTGATVKTSQLA